MKVVTWSLMCRFAALLIVCSACGEPRVDVAEEKAAVRAVWDEVNAALLAKDWDRYAQLFVHGPDFQMVQPGHRDWIAGWDDFKTTYEPLVTGEGQWDLQTNRFDVRISPLGDAAWAMLEFVYSVEGGTEIVNWELVVFMKVEGLWRVASAIAAQLPD